MASPTSLGLTSSTLLHFGRTNEFALRSASATPGKAHASMTLLSTFGSPWICRLRGGHVSVNSSLIIHHSSFITPHSSFIIPHSSFIIHHSPFLIPHSSFIIHHSSFIPLPLAIISTSSLPFLYPFSTFFVELM